MRFSTLAFRNKHCPWPYVSSRHFWSDSFPILSPSSFLTCMCWPLLDWILKGDFLPISDVLSLQLSPLLYSVLWTLGALTSLGYQFHFLNSVRSLCSFGNWPDFPLPALSRKEALTTLGLISFVSLLSGITVLPWLMSNVLRAIVSYIVWFFVFFSVISSWKVNSVPVTWPEPNVSSESILIIYIFPDIVYAIC